MIKIIFDFTEAEEKEIDEIEARYSFKIIDCEDHIAKLKKRRKDPPPDMSDIYKTIDLEKDPEKREAAGRQAVDTITKWITAGGAKWVARWEAEHNEWRRLNTELNQERHSFYTKAKQRRFDELGNDPQIILNDAKQQAEKYISAAYNNYRQKALLSYGFSALDVVSLGDGRWKLDAGQTRKIIKDTIRLHYAALSSYEDITRELNTHIDSIIKASPYIAPEGTPGRGERITLRPQPTASGDEIGAAAPEIEPIPTLLEQNGYIRMLQGKGTNSLSQMSSRRMVPQIDAFTGKATFNYNNFTAYIDNYNNLPGLLNLNALILLDYCALYLSQLNDYGREDGLKTTVNIPLDDYMRRCGIPITKSSADKARREVKAALETLYNLSIEFDEAKTTKEKKKLEHYHMRILQERSDIKNGIIYARFGQSFVEYLNKCGLMEYSTALLKIDRRNPTAYHIGRKLCFHNSIDNNRKRGTANNISVKALLEYCPDIPSYEEVSETDRHYRSRIIEPFEAALNALEDKYQILDSWEYCNKLKTPLTEEQLKDLDYQTFIKLQIKFILANAPDPKARLAVKAEEAKKRSAKKQPAVKRTYKKKTEPKGEG